MSEVTSSRKLDVLVEPMMCPYTSTPLDGRWGQLPLSLYDLTVEGDIMSGQSAWKADAVYVCLAEPNTEVNSQLLPAQSWFWTPQWQAMEREADDDLASGNYVDFETMSDFIEDLKRLMENQ